MKKNTLFLLAGIGLAITLANTASAQYTTYGSNYGSSGTVCTMDAYVCPNGTTVGRTGPNCQFVCPTTTTPPNQTPGCTNPNYGYNYYGSNTYGCTMPSASYTYTVGCSIYYYNGTTRQTTLIGYTCNTNTYTQPTYTYPTYNYYTTPYYSQYYTYGYNNGTWYPGYTPTSIFETSYDNYNYYDPYYNNYNYNNWGGCYTTYQGVRVCQ